MIYILDTEINNNKSVKYALQKVYGLGKHKAKNICHCCGFSSNLRVNELTPDQIKYLLKTIEVLDFVLVGELRKLHSLFLRKMVRMKLVRGLRRVRGLPVRGQRTHTNAKTAKRFKRSS